MPGRPTDAVRCRFGGPDLENVLDGNPALADERRIARDCIGVELGDPGSLDELLRRMEHSQLQVEVIDPESPFYRFLV